MSCIKQWKYVFPCYCTVCKCVFFFLLPLWLGEICPLYLCLLGSLTFTDFYVGKISITGNLSLSFSPSFLPPIVRIEWGERSGAKILKKERGQWI